MSNLIVKLLLSAVGFMRTVHAKLMEFELALQSDSIYFLIRPRLPEINLFPDLSAEDYCTLSTGNNFREVHAARGGGNIRLNGGKVEFLRLGRGDTVFGSVSFGTADAQCRTVCLNKCVHRLQRWQNER